MDVPATAADAKKKIDARMAGYASPVDFYVDRLAEGIATLTAVNGATPLWLADSKGIDVSGIMIDAGTVNSPVLLQVGKPHAHKSDPADPTSVQRPPCDLRPGRTAVRPRARQPATSTTPKLACRTSARVAE